MNMAPAEVERLAVCETKLDHIHSDVSFIRSRLAGRPSWSMTILLTVESSLVVGLATALLGRI